MRARLQPPVAGAAAREEDNGGRDGTPASPAAAVRLSATRQEPRHRLNRVTIKDRECRSQSALLPVRAFLSANGECAVCLHLKIVVIVVEYRHEASFIVAWGAWDRSREACCRRTCNSPYSRTSALSSDRGSRRAPEPGEPARTRDDDVAIAILREVDAADGENLPDAAAGGCDRQRRSLTGRDRAPARDRAQRPRPARYAVRTAGNGIDLQRARGSGGRQPALGQRGEGLRWDRRPDTTGIHGDPCCPGPTASESNFHAGSCPPHGRPGCWPGLPSQTWSLRPRVVKASYSLQERLRG